MIWLAIDEAVESARAATAETVNPVDQWMEARQQSLEWLSNFLRPWYRPLDVYLAGLDPDTTGRWCVAALFGIVLLWVFTLKRDFVFQGAPSRARWADLRLWAAAAMAPYVMIYLLLF
jgi:hypothetical protein